MSTSPSPPQAPKQDPDTLVLRAPAPQVVRLRRGLIVGLTASAAAFVVALSWFALEPSSLGVGSAIVEDGEPGGTVEKTALEGLPGSYANAPRLGPPLPGDLGRPILEQQRLDATVSAPAASHPPAIAVDAEMQRHAVARLAAQTSPVLVALQGERQRSGEAVDIVRNAIPGESPGREPESPLAASQQRKIDFVETGGGTVDPNAMQGPASPWILQAGTIIPASLITGVNSDLPGAVLAQVTENVRDSATGSVILVPQGARLIGRYDSVVSYGQRRALIVWTRILFPDGWSITLDNVPATDAHGYAGLADRVDGHGWQLLKGIALSTLFGVGTQLSLESESELVRALRESAQESVAHAGDQITTRNLDIKPTLTVRPGFPVRALLNKDLVLKPWRPR